MRGQGRVYRGSEARERLTVFAVLGSGGTIVEGRSAYDAMMRSCQAGYESHRNTGFMTSHGRFVREGREALMLAFRAGQLRKNTSLYKWLSQGVLPLWEVRDYGTESLVRGVGGRLAKVAPPPPAIIAALIDENGVTRRPPTNPIRAAYLKELAWKAGQPSNLNNPDGGPGIESRALKYGDDDGEHLEALERFSRSGYIDPATGKAQHVIEGYLLTDGSFITRDEAKEIFATADIGPARADRTWHSVVDRDPAS